MATVSLPSNLKQDKDATNMHIVRVGLLTLSSSYTTGGESLTPAALGLGMVDIILFEPPTNATPANDAVSSLKYDYTNSKVLGFDDEGAEVANGVDLSAFTARFIAFGK